MSSAASRPLTERQQAVMERIDRRVPIKVIAQELGVSETRVNQHIRALKDIFEAGSLGDLVERYRKSQGPEGQAAEAPQANRKEPAEEPENSVQSEKVTSSDKPLSEPAYKKSELPEEALATQIGLRADQGELVMGDVLPLIEQAPWLRFGEPKVVPGVLDGEHAVLFRLGAIVGIAFGFLAAVVLTVTAAVTLSEALDGRATVPVDEQGFP